MPTQCKGECRRAKFKDIVRSVRGNHKQENKGKPYKTCSVCEIGFYLKDWSVYQCFCCHAQFKTRKTYKPEPQKNRLGKLEDKIRVKIVMTDHVTGDRMEFYKVVPMEEAIDKKWEEAQVIYL